jgi:uncharacterized membrane protein
MNTKIRWSLEIAIASITAALYFVLGFFLQPIGFLQLQFRIAEILVGIVILFPIGGIIGNVLGVLIVNIFSPLGPLDLLSAPVNIIALLPLALLRDKKFLKYVGALIYSAIISIYVALLLYVVLHLPVWISFLQVLASETILSVIGVLLFSLIKPMVAQYV